MARISTAEGCKGWSVSVERFVPVHSSTLRQHDRNRAVAGVVRHENGACSARKNGSGPSPLGTKLGTDPNLGRAGRSPYRLDIDLG